MVQIFTRQAFYDLVWSKPVTHIAKQFALSDVAIHKVCKKHNIPTPPPGWWAKKAVGKATPQVPLPFSVLVALDTIRIVSGELRQESELTSQARERARIIASDIIDTSPPPPHPIVTRTISDLEKGKPNEQGVIAVSGPKAIKCAVAPTSIERLKTILPAVVAAVQRQGFQLEAGSESAQFIANGETIGVSISEAINRVEHVLTPGEQAKLDAWEKKRETARKRNSWDAYLAFDKPQTPPWDYHPNGILAVEFEQVYVWPGTSPRRTFRDTKNRRLEDLASEISVGLAVLASAKTEQRLKREEQERQAAEARKKRIDEARSNYVERRREEALKSLLTEIDELDQLRRLISLLSTRLPDAPGERVPQFVQWAQEHLQLREADLAPNVLEGRFANKKLFGSDDDHGFHYTGW